MDMDLSNKLEKFIKKYSLCPMADSVLPQKLFGIESDFVSKNSEIVTPYVEGIPVDYARQIKIFMNDKAGKSGRAKWFLVDKNKVNINQKYLNEWQVVVSSANAGGQKRDRQLQIIDNHSAFGRARVALGSFEHKKRLKIFMNM